MFSNEKDHGGNMLSIVEANLKDSDNVVIASGYVSGDIIAKFKDLFYQIAERGSFKLMVGMAFYEGLGASVLRNLIEIDNKLRTINSNSGVFVCYTRRFHGKIYSFESKGKLKIYVGSSNFSRSGILDNLECTVPVTDVEIKKKIENYLKYLFSARNAKFIEDANVVARGSTKYIERIAQKYLSDFERYDPTTIDTSSLPFFEYKLSTIKSPKSGLNVYFGVGRKDKKGKVKPRPWYEAEIIAPKKVIDNPLYPKGEFTAYTDDGYIIPMNTNGQNYKNIRSKGGLKILGQWIKTKLQDSGALVPLTPVTANTYDEYGNDTIRFYKIADREYYMEF